MAAKIVLLAFVCAVIDLTVSSLLLLHLDKPSMYALQFLHFEFCSSFSDLWIISLCRVSLLVGTAVGIGVNLREAIARIVRLKSAVMYTSVGVVIYAVAKFLWSTECNLTGKTKLCLWTFVAWTIVSSIGISVIYRWISKTRLQVSRIVPTQGEIGSVLEHQRLLDDDGNDDGESDSSSEDSHNSSDDSREDQSTSAWKLLSYCKPDVMYLVLAGVCLIAAAVGEIFITYYTGLVIDSIAIEKDGKKFLNSVLLMTFIALVTAFFTGVRGALFTYISARLNVRISKKLFRSVVHQDMGFFDNTKTGDIVSRLTSDTLKMSEQVGLNLNVFLRNVVQCIGTCIFMFKLSWKLSLACVMAIPLVVLVSEAYGEYYKKVAAVVQDAIAEANKVATEVISSIKTIRSFANEDGECASYDSKQAGILKSYLKQSVLYGGYRWCTESLALLLDVLILLYGGHLVLRGELSGGNLVSFILYQFQMMMCIDEVGDVYTALMEATGASKKVFELIERSPDILNNGIEKPSEFHGEIEFQHVSFAYPSRPNVPILGDVSFKVKSGAVVALIGSSGGGKSTCISLLEHFYEPSSGQILLDSIPIQNFDHKYIHRKMALVGQEPILFAKSIKENIAYALESEEESNMELVERVARLANAADFIGEMPNGYDTQSGEKGLQLSGGQKQRVAIARALARNPQILLLDEATSALDAESEHLIQNAVYQNLRGRTILIIAHRLSTIEKADQIIVIDQGKVMEQGNHAELIQNNGLYAKLVQRQMLGQVAASPEIQWEDGALFNFKLLLQ